MGDRKGEQRNQVQAHDLEDFIQVQENAIFLFIFFWEGGGIPWLRMAQNAVNVA